MRYQDLYDKMKPFIDYAYYLWDALFKVCILLVVVNYKYLKKSDIQKYYRPLFFYLTLVLCYEIVSLFPITAMINDILMFSLWVTAVKTLVWTSFMETKKEKDPC